MSVLPGLPDLVGLGAAIPEISFLQSNSEDFDRTTFTFSGESLGVAAADRYIIVGICGRDFGGTASFSSVTIGGVTADQRVVVTNSQGISAIYTALVPTGTTGDVVVTSASANWTSCSIHLWRVVGGLSSIIPENTASITVDNTNMSVDVSANGFVLAVSRNGLTTCTWSGVTEEWDFQAGTNMRVSGAWDTFASAQTVLAKPNWATGSFVTAVAASFR